MSSAITTTSWSSQQSLDEPRQLILALLPKFKSSSDVFHVNALKGQINAITEENRRILTTSLENVAAWTKKLEIARLDSVRPLHLSHEKHLEQLAALESEKFQLAKQIRDAECAIESLEVQLFQAQQELHGLKKENMEPIELSEYELRLRIYRSLGVSLLDDLPSENMFASSVRVRVANLESRDIHLVTINDNEHSMFELTNHIWELCSQ